MSNTNIEEFSHMLRENRLLEKYRIEKVSLFGSFARGEDANDIDIFVENVKDYDALIEFRKELEALTKKKIDIMIDEFANPIVLHRARKDMVDVS